MPSYKDLFGSHSLCECKHCRSVYSPAAYLVDVLHHALTDQEKQILFAPDRRPDLERVELSCKNTDTPMPYIDLVNEVLENAVSPRPLNGPWPQTTRTAEELATNTEHMNGQAYSRLAGAVFPWDLPFDPGAEEARTFLDHLGVSRREIMSVFRRRNPLGPSELAEAGESLGLTRFERQIITGGYEVRVTTTAALASLSGLQTVDGVALAENDRVLVKDQVDPKANGPYLVKNNAWARVGDEDPDGRLHKSLLVLVTDGAQKGTRWALTIADDGKVEFVKRESWDFWGLTNTWLTELAKVPVFLKQSGLAYGELLELLQTRFVNPDKNDLLVVKFPDAHCDLDKAVLDPSRKLTEGLFHRIHRFVRLRRKLGWSIRELDRALATLKTPDLTDKLIGQLSHLQHLRSEFRSSVDEILPLWADIGTDGEGSLYQRLFQNPAVFSPVDKAFDLKLDRTELADTTGRISDHTAPILAALQINAQELAAVREAAGLAADNETLSLFKLSRLYRVALLARALELSARDIRSLQILTGLDPFDPSRMEDLRRFAASAERVRSSGFSFAVLNYLYRHVPAPAEGLPPSEELLLLAKELGDGLRKIGRDQATASAETRESLSRSFIKKELGRAFQWEDAAADALLEGPLAAPLTKLLPLSQEGLSASYFDNPDLNGPAKLQRIEAAVSFNFGAGSPDIAAVPADHFSARWEGRVAASTSETYTFHVRADNRVRLMVDGKLLVDKWQDQAETEHSAAVALKAGRLYELGLEYGHRTGASRVELRWESPSTPKEVVPAGALYPKRSWEAATDAFSLLHKAALLIRTFPLRSREVTHLAAHGADFDGFDFAKLPLDSAAFKPDLFRQWQRMYDLVTLRKSLPQGPVDLTQVFSASSLQEAKEKLVQATGWDAKALQELTGPDGFDLQRADFKSEIWLLRLQACLRLMRRSGASAKSLFAWAAQEPDLSQAQEVRNTAKAKYGDQEWLSVAKPLQDGLREKKRSALVAYLLTDQAIRQKGVANANGLFQHFLIDVEMSPCMATSRIKQAIGSVQLFVQRALMNLEPGVALTADRARHWITWMKHYRVWEANRKVFLYPENWIEPELRDDKTPFFKELEDELLQGELTMVKAEDAFLHYLEKLDEVARLEIGGLYHDEATDTFHVIGRTWSLAPAYYYRRRTKAGWTPWEKVEADIQGDHLIPVVWNRRLHLFWPEFIEKSAASSDEDKRLQREPRKFLEIRLAWSEHKKGRWSAKQLSKETIRTLYPSDKADVFFKGLFEGETLVIRCVSLIPWGRIPYDTDEQLQDALKKQFQQHISYEVGEFRLTGCGGRAILKSFQETNHYFLTPWRSGWNHMALAEDNTTDEDTLYLSTGHFPPGPDYNKLINAKKDAAVLRLTPGHFRLSAPHQDEYFSAQQRPFFFEDNAKTFLVTRVAGQEQDIVDLRKVYVGMDNFFKEKFPYEMMAKPAVDPVPDSSLYSPALALGDGGFSLGHPHAAALMTPALESPGRPRPMVVGDEIFASTGILPRIDPYDQRKDAAVRALKQTMGYAFEVFYHPYVCEAVRQLNREGIDGLLRWPMERRQPASNPPRPRDFVVNFFKSRYDPIPGAVKTPYPPEELDFTDEGATPYSQYNWELFLHAPLLIADRLSKNQNFAEAQKWFHYVFDPTERSGYTHPQARFWKMRRFFDDTEKKPPQTLQELMENAQQVQEQAALWRDNPFNPHLLARMRLVAYQKSVVMKYIDNLIAWGDRLFRRETIEALNEATHLYILAAEILGPRPALIPPPAEVPHSKTYSDIKTSLDALSNKLVDVEHLVQLDPLGHKSVGTGWHVVATLAKGAQLFCIPGNDKLLGYWDTVADRLFKIRHCMNIEGVARKLPLFEPPIDPALLVRAAAAGVDLASVLNDINAPLPPYRFTTMIQKAAEFCAEVRALGQALLAVLEKKDGEELAKLRAKHEVDLLSAVRDVKRKQIDEAKETLAGLREYEKVVAARQQYYLTLPRRIAEEQSHQQLLKSNIAIQTARAVYEVIASGVHYVPETKLGSPATIGFTYGGANIGNALKAFGESLGTLSGILNTSAALVSTEGGYVRRNREWDHQADLAAKELEQVKKQILAGDIRLQIVERDLVNHDKQREQSREVSDYLRGKFTNQDLYGWMGGQLSALYFQSYQMAYDLAKRAERAYQFERADLEAGFIKFGYWDSLRGGLLAGERLSFDLKRLEAAYLDQNKREYEITKHVSLAMLDPQALLTLKHKGACDIKLPEELFDADYPGHFLRRLKSVSLTIPCVTGPYTGVNCTLTLLKNSVRVDSRSGSSYKRSGPDDRRFRDGLASIPQSIVTSHGQNDSGIFELNFRDDRYLPFEGAGAISEWQIQLDPQTNRFDLSTIADVVLHLKYTAREGGESLKKDARAALPKGGVWLVRAKHEFSGDWHRFLHPAENDTTQSLVLDLGGFPFQPEGKGIKIARMDAFMKLKSSPPEDVPLELFDDVTAKGRPADDNTRPTNHLKTLPLMRKEDFGGLHHAGVAFSPARLPGKWVIQVQGDQIPLPLHKPNFSFTAAGKTYHHLDPDAVEDIFLVCRITQT